MNERDFLVLAQTLVGMPDEAAWRSAVSRAYYAAFHVARHLLEGLGFAVPRADRAHAYLWMRLGNCGDILTQQASVNLNALRGERNRADYDLGTPMRQTIARARVRTAEQIIQTLDSAAAGPMLISIRDEMIRYERDVLQDVTWVP